MKDRSFIPKFYSSEIRPGFRPLLILTAAVLVMGAAALVFAGSGFKFALICVTVTLYALGVAAILILNFRQQIKYDPYSYNTIFYAGFALFILALAIMYAVLAFHMFRDPENYRELMLIHTIAGSAKTFMVFTAPLVLAFSIALIVSNISLIRHEGGGLVNYLGIILSVLFLGGWIFLYAVDFYASGSQFDIMIHEIETDFFAAVYLYVECMVVGTIIAGFISARHEPDKDRDYMLVLGCALRKDGTPTPLLRGRIDRAIQFYEAQKNETGKELTFVTSGGQGSDEVVSESASMKRYLMEQGIPEERIIEEDRSTNTLENMQFSKAKIDERGGEPKVAFSTTNYHVFRSGFFAKSAGMKAEGVGAPTKWYFWPNAAVREFVGLLTKKRGLQLTILCAMIAFYVTLAILAYSIDL
ncbi:MAG: YdcF family protein [Clostridia bacterium]|nr:YdcF family protein [Clostridia bacterium]